MGEFSGARTGESVEQRLSRLEDIEAIKALKERYAALCDNNYDPDGIAALFVEDGQYLSEALGNHYGREAIRQFMTGVRDAIVWAQHFMVAPVVKVAPDGQTATGTWYLLDLVTMPGVDDPEKRDAVVITANYQNDFVKVDGEWKFHTIRADLKMMANLDEGWAERPFRGEFKVARA
jgi:uncharacterized protein (TIGR02246 family)